MRAYIMSHRNHRNHRKADAMLDMPNGLSVISVVSV